MRLERDCDRFRATPSGAISDFEEDPRVCPVHAVKIADADQRWAELSRNFFDVMENIHAEKLGNPSSIVG
jgi:hypothetical protein